MKEYVDVFLTALAIIAAFVVAGLAFIALLWLAKQILL